MNTQLHRAFDKLDLIKQDRTKLIPALLGFPINGVETVDIPDRPGYVYARMRSNFNEVVQVFNDKVSPVYDLPVLLVRDSNNPTRYRVEGRDVGRYENWGSSSSFLPKHGNQHSFNPAGGGGGDIVWAYSQQIVPWLVSPSGSYGAGNVVIHGHPRQTSLGWQYPGGTGTSSLLTYKPTGSYARMVLVYLDEAGNPQLDPGDFFSATVTGTDTILGYLPGMSSLDTVPLAGILLVSGTSTITWDEIFDVRPFFSGIGNSSAMNLTDLADVAISSPVSGSYLRYNGTNWVNASGSVVGSLNDLSDVTIGSIVSGSYLRYNGSQWVNISGSAGSSVGALDDLSDVTITGLSSGSSLQYNGSQWINRLQARFPEGIIVGHYPSDYTLFNGYGEFYFRGQALRWEKESLPFTAGHVGSSAPTWASITGSFSGYQFAVNNNMVFALDLPLDWFTFDIAKVYISWETSSPEIANKWVKWQVEYKAANRDLLERYGEYVSGTLTAETMIPSGTSTNVAMFTEVGDLAIDNDYNIGTTIQFVVTRLSSSSGTAPVIDPFGVVFGIHYRLDSLGAFSPTQKTVSG